MEELNCLGCLGSDWIGDIHPINLVDGNDTRLFQRVAGVVTIYCSVGIYIYIYISILRM